ncbi:MAG: aldose 1-epimerase family protein [Candidatus Omnitrophica bacterium]|nr:aldose 1-epimerase family protein [Candidatus Omnitrophota bacterium]
MAQVYGKNYSKKELLKRVGDMFQIAGIKRYTFSEGNEKGVNAIDVKTGSGFSFTVLPDRGMDISDAEYKGRALCWRSSTGNIAPEFFEPEGSGFLRSFFGGLLTTCGLTYAGHPCVDEGGQLGLHGRINNIPAKNVWTDSMWNKDEYTLTVQGRVHETRVFGENILLTRTITTKLGESRLYIKDVVENHGFEKTPHMILYHINAGFPVLDEGSRLISPTKTAHPRDAEAEKDANEYNIFSGPVTGYNEKCYYHQMESDKNGFVSVAVVNEKCDNGTGFGLYIKYSFSQLPEFLEWKMTGEGIYVVGIEPSNCHISTRAQLRKEGKLPFLTPGEKKEYRIEIGVLPSNKEIKEFEDEF